MIIFKIQNKVILLISMNNKKLKMFKIYMINIKKDHNLAKFVNKNRLNKINQKLKYFKKIKMFKQNKNGQIKKIKDFATLIKLIKNRNLIMMLIILEIITFNNLIIKKNLQIKMYKLLIKNSTNVKIIMMNG